MTYDTFLFDADDTLFDFKASERVAFFGVLDFFGDTGNFDEIFDTYRSHSRELWRQFEQSKISVELLKVERFRRTTEQHGLYTDPERMARMYLEILSDTVVLIDGAEDICKHLSATGEVAILTNGVGDVQRRRLKSSKLAPYISFMAISEDCGFAKPDGRFFDYATKMSRRFKKDRALMIGDRLDADILGAHNYGMDACFFNPHGASLGDYRPKFHIDRLLKLKELLR